MNKGQWIILGFTGLALATSAAYISIQWNASPVNAPAVAEPSPAPAVTGAGAVPAPSSQPETAPTASRNLTEEQARALAVSMLLGDPYGRTEADVLRTITRTTRSTENGKTEWVFDIRVPGSPDLPEGIAGQLRVDASNSRVATRDLPFIE